MSSSPPQASKKQFLVLSRGQWDESASQQEVQAAIDRFYRWYERCLEQGTMLPGSRLANEGKRVARSSITDGPFTETKELVGGYWFIVAGSLDEAAALAAENPCLKFGLSLEIRPLDAERAQAASVTSETPPAWRSR
jgi:hypothetical protein